MTKKKITLNKLVTSLTNFINLKIVQKKEILLVDKKEADVFTIKIK
jgi:hypothetical protein